MNAQQAENLRTLIRHMETNVTRTLYMPIISESCGTPACAMGEACMVESFGLSFNKGWNYSLFLNGTSINLGDAAERVFGDAKCKLFNGHLRGASRPSPHDWAIEARKVLAEYGYSMDEPKPDAFPAFMAKLMQPVAVTA